MPNVSGKELLSVFHRQAGELGAQYRTGLVRQIVPDSREFMLLVENDVLQARSVVLAMGAARPQLLPGEEDAVGSGVSYCATCDGMLYRGKKIAILSGSAQGREESEFLSGLAAKTDYYSLKAHIEEPLPPKVERMPEKPVSLAKENGKMLLTTDAGAHEYDGIFIFRTAVPLSMLISDLRTEGPFISVNRAMQTSVNGVFAAGDCTGQPLQVAKAVGEGNVAAISAAEYLHQIG